MKKLLTTALVVSFGISLSACRKGPQPEGRSVNVAPPPAPKEVVTPRPAEVSQAAPVQDATQVQQSPPPVQPMDYKGPMNAPALPVITGKGSVKNPIPKGGFTAEGKK